MVLQIAKDIGGKANARALADAAEYYENSAVRRLGYLLDLANHSRQAKLLPILSLVVLPWLARLRRSTCRLLSDGSAGWLAFLLAARHAGAEQNLCWVRVRGWR